MQTPHLEHLARLYQAGAYQRFRRRLKAITLRKRDLHAHTDPLGYDRPTVIPLESRIVLHFHTIPDIYLVPEQVLIFMRQGENPVMVFKHEHRTVALPYDKNTPINYDTSHTTAGVI